ncbi:hypothetical protein [Candidatus Poriferisodalis sp.]|uniref:hypothetical protein n=1 Tax=Candidatus Poriferisodalis sp. TaxID=3101277 RepID=UPI003B01DC3B
MTRRAAWLSVLASVALSAAACTAAGSSVTVDTSLDPAVVDALDADGDGVVSRSAVEAAIDQAAAEAEAAAQQAQLEAEREAIEAQRAARQNAYKELFDDRSAMAASIGREQVLVGEVRDNIAEWPITQMEDPLAPTIEEFVSRLTSMIRLRLAGLVIDAFGFPVDFSGTEAEIDAQVRAHLTGDFEAFAQQRALEQEPQLERLATPHCVSVLVVDSEADAVAAVERIRAGESFAEVADEVNVPDFAEAGGTVGCGLLFELLGPSELAVTLLDVAPGELSKPLLLETTVGPQWVVGRVDSLDTDATDLASIGPFANRLLGEEVTAYTVDIAPALGAWSVDNQSVTLPPMP